MKNLKLLMRKIRYFGLFLPLSQLFLTVFGKYLSKRSITKITDLRNKKIKKLLLPFVSEALKNLQKQSSDNQINYKGKIWFCWLQGEKNLTPISRLCYESIQKNSSGNDVIFLSLDNLKDYANLPEIVYERFKNGDIKPAHFADILRINLLAQKGGLWLDSTMFVIDSLPAYIFEDEFWTIKIKEFGHYISKCRWSVFALASHPGNKLFTALSSIFEAYLKKYPVLVDYFMFDQLINLLYEEDRDIKRMIDNVPFNNLNVYSLVKALQGNESIEKFEIEKGDTYIFKLSNKIDGLSTNLLEDLLKKLFNSQL